MSKDLDRCSSTKPPRHLVIVSIWICFVQVSSANWYCLTEKRWNYQCVLWQWQWQWCNIPINIIMGIMGKHDDFFLMTSTIIETWQYGNPGEVLSSRNCSMAAFDNSMPCFCRLHRSTQVALPAWSVTQSGTFACIQCSVLLLLVLKTKSLPNA